MKEFFSLGSTARIFFDLVVGAVGQTGESPQSSLQRASDGRWFQASDGTWQVTRIDNAMTALDAANLPGRYYLDFDQTLDDSAGPYEYTVRLINSGSPALLEYRDIAFGQRSRVVLPGLCSVQGTVVGMDGNPVPNSLVSATLLPVYTDGLGRGVEKNEITTRSNSSGDFDLPLVRGIRVRLQIGDIGFDKAVAVPDQASVLFTAL